MLLQVGSAQAQPETSAPLLSNANTTALPGQGMPEGLIYDDQDSPYLFWAELGAGILHLLERTETGYYFTRSSVPISIGKAGFGKKVEGDLKTPVGIYKITSFLTDDQLTDKYGTGAYPLNYPNNWDRIKQRTGHGIWLHGLPKGVIERPLLDSDGCVVVSNAVLDNFKAYIKTGESTFVLSEKLDWLSQEAQQYPNDLIMVLNEWQKDWSANNNDAYLNHYHPDFTDARRNLQQWKTYKTRINKSKRYISVKLSQVSIIAYPGEENLVSSRFYQDYQSSNFSWRGWKQLLWRRLDNGEWKILFEGNG
ncbi:L,D-transpeptidase family protein [Pseudomonadales bacterium]|nr:L,D-transpeptidase family protein [Pseudomonadales bacterium]